MVFLILLFFLVFTSPVFADSSVKITDFSSDSNPEWIQLTNNTSETVSLSGWYFKDKAGVTKNISGCLSGNSNQVFSFGSGWLNNSISGTEPYADIIYLFNPLNEAVDTYSYAEGVEKTAPTSTNTCVITPTPTIIPTSDPAITNPASGITLTEFMPYSSIEWIEIYNNNDYPVKLIGWKIGHNTSTTKNFDLTINSKSYGTFDFSNFLNNDGDKIILYDNNNNNRGERSYESNKYTLDRSWSLVNNSWCQADLTKGNSNATSCYSAPTNTPTPTFTPTPTKPLSPTPTPDQGKYTPDESATASAIIDPINISSPSITPTTNPTPTNSVSFTETNSSKPKKRYLPLIFIISGGCLLVSPLAINKIKKQK